MNVQGSRTAASRLDDAARAAWLYYVAGNTQDEIAEKLGVSRQSAQRLVSLAVSEKLVKVRVDHPIGRCMDLASELQQRFSLVSCDVVPTDPSAPDLLAGIGIAAAAEIERVLKRPEPQIIALGTGRALRAGVEQVSRMSCPQHRIVSLLGNTMTDGSATPYNATIAMADRVGAPHYPYPLPVLAADEAERETLRNLSSARASLALCEQADLVLVGIGQMDDSAPILADGFVTPAEMTALRERGAVGEITCWVYDRQGRFIDSDLGRRVTSAPLPAATDRRRVIAVAAGQSKVPAMRAALEGRLVNSLITSEATAAAVLSL